MTNAEDFAPLDPVHLVTQAQGWSIIYSPGGPEWHQHKGALERHGIEGSGYDFSGALRATLTDHEPSVLDAVGFDPEGGMVSVYGSDLGALHAATRRAPSGGGAGRLQRERSASSCASCHSAT